MSPSPIVEERAKGYCFAHVVWSVQPSVTFSFLINNSRRPRPNILKLGPHIHRGYQKNTTDFGVAGSKVKVTRVKCAKIVLLSITRECLDLPSSNLVHTSILDSRGTLLILVFNNHLLFNLSISIETQTLYVQILRDITI